MFPEQSPYETDGGTLDLDRGVAQKSAPVSEQIELSSSQPQIDTHLERLHEESLLRYPNLNIGRGEYVILALRRNTIGLLAIWFVVGLLTALFLISLPFYSLNHDAIATMLGANPSNLLPPAVLAIPLLFIDSLFILGGFLASNVYSQNRLYLTNESIIQYNKTSLFDTQLQHLNLINVDDVSSRQRGPIQYVLNYGTINISTPGEKTVYAFEFVNNPEKIVHIINDAVENATGSSASYWARQPEKN
ncbi:MAG TPA: hypothetical protein VNX65_05090 [Patescibacteria group bacterium]|jgi:hypothetical protein|nr:hypothetical protein [Patescibacteria group bacterium]